MEFDTNQILLHRQHDCLYNKKIVKSKFTSFPNQIIDCNECNCRPAGWRKGKSQFCVNYILSFYCKIWATNSCLHPILLLKGCINMSHITRTASGVVKNHLESFIKNWTSGSIFYHLYLKNICNSLLINIFLLMQPFCCKIVNFFYCK
jgi:hypothetical protein